MLIIRLSRTGKKNAASYRLVLIEKSAGPQSGKFLETLGSYNPRSKEAILDVDKIKEWLSKGVKTSETVHNLLVANKVIEGPKIKKKLRASKKAGSEKPEKVSETSEPQTEEAGSAKKQEESETKSEGESEAEEVEAKDASGEVKSDSEETAKEKEAVPEEGVDVSNSQEEKTDSKKE